jgi:hypothetical protein
MATVIICPGIHDRTLTQEFLLDLAWPEENLLVVPTRDCPPYSAVSMGQWVRDRLSLEEPTIWLAFSAGVVGAIGAAWGWQLAGGKVLAFIALDGWGVPLFGNFPIHRLSHDRFTHWSSALLGAGADSFYADPAVEHLDLWRSPSTACGWRISSGIGRSLEPTRTVAAVFITELLHDYVPKQPTKTSSID